jgi:hypothetical protein
MRKLALLCLALTSCGTTGGKLIQISFRAGGLSRAAAGPLTFTTSTGWTVTLQKARIALGPFYFNSQSAVTDSFRGGLVIIEATEQVVIDPLDPTLKDIAGGADGQTGDALSCEIGLLQADQTASAADRQLLGFANGASCVSPQCNIFAYVAGTATNGPTTVPFAGNIAVNPSQISQQSPLPYLQRVNGATVNLSFTAQTQAVELRVDPRIWFATADFSALVGVTPSQGNYWDATNCTQSSTTFDGARCTFQTNLYTGVTQRNDVYQFAVTP